MNNEGWLVVRALIDDTSDSVQLLDHEEALIYKAN